MKQGMGLLLLLCGLLLLLPVQAGAKDLQGMIGVGFDRQLISGLQDSDLDGQLSVKYWPSSSYAVQGVTGWNFTDDGKNEYTLGGKFIYPFHTEEQLYLYLSGGMLFHYIDPDQRDSETAVNLQPGVGVEYFFQGLPNLGISTEIGCGFYSNGDDSFYTSPSTELVAGVHYYF